jgi:hypothetical protein
MIHFNVQTRLVLSFTLLLGLMTVYAQDATASHAASDHGHDLFQPAYVDGKIVTYQPGSPAPEGVSESSIRALYEVKYPTNWQETLARPLCTYCDHFGDGENAWDFHDHVLASLPTQEQNETGEVYWHVFHIAPSYTGEAITDAAITETYLGFLPAQSAEEVDTLSKAALPDGTAIAQVVDVGYVFAGPLIRW